MAAALRELNARLRVAGMTDEEARSLPVQLDADTLASAEKAWAGIRAMVESKQGDLLGYPPNTSQQVRAATVAGWSIKGHYLAFCVIGRADGHQIPDRDPIASQTMYDIVEMYLKGVILEARATNPRPGAGASGPPTPRPSG